MPFRSVHTRPGGPDAHHRSREDSERAHRRIIRRVWLGFAVVVVVLVFMVWSADVISWEDERTIYTVECVGGAWANGQCSGELKAADRIRFRASKSRNEVVFWTLGTPKNVERMAPCQVQDGRNWSCAPAPDAHKPVPQALTQGHVAPDPGNGAQPLHVVKKWRWWLLKIGVPT